jgi:hypothetical protein
MKVNVGKSQAGSLNWPFSATTLSLILLELLFDPRQGEL